MDDNTLDADASATERRMIMAHCKDCIHFNVCEAFGKTVKFHVDDGVCLHFAKDINVPTNADRIRAMSDEELIGFLVQFQEETINRFARFEFPNYSATADWLQQPAEKKS